MERFYRAHRYKILTAILVLVLVFVGFYVLEVHVPYTKHEQNLDKVERSICQKYEFTSLDYINEYYTDQTYYILYVRAKDQTKEYVVFDEKYNYVTNFTDAQYPVKKCIKAFKKKYQVEPSNVEIGYENMKLCYALKYRGKESMIYAFYDMSTGDFMKAYQL